MRSENILTTPLPVPDIPDPRARRVTFFPVTMGVAKRKPARHQNKPTLDQLMDEESWRNLTNHDTKYVLVAACGLDETGLMNQYGPGTFSKFNSQIHVSARFCQ